LRLPFIFPAYFPPPIVKHNKPKIASYFASYLLICAQ